MGSLISANIVMQKVVSLSVNVVELIVGVTLAQYMLYIIRVLESIGLKVKEPMILEMGNKVAYNIAKNLSVGGRTCHIGAWKFFLRDLKEEGLLLNDWIPEAYNETDLLTKNLPGTYFKRHAETILTKL